MRESIVAIIELVDVLPCVPATATVLQTAREMREHLGPRPHLDTAAASLGKLGVGLRNRRRDHHDLRVPEVLGGMADRDGNARAARARVE